MADLAGVFAKMTDPYLRERGRDGEVVVERVIRELVGKTNTSFSSVDEPVVVVAHELTPAETAHMAFERVLGFATDIGSPTSHAAIVAKSLRIPAVVGLKNATQQGRAFCTFDSDLLQIAASGVEHAGIVFGQQDIHYIGEWVNWLTLMHAVYKPEEMFNRIEFL